MILKNVYKLYKKLLKFKIYNIINLKKSKLKKAIFKTIFNYFVL